MGIYKRGNTFWMSYWVGKKLYRESAKTPDQQEAQLKYERLMAELIINPTLLDGRSVTVGQLLQDVINDYTTKGNRSKKVVESRIDRILKPWWGSYKAIDVNTQLVRSYIAHRLKLKVAHAQINLEIAAVRRAFKLAHRDGLLPKIPHFPLLRVNNARQGFFEAEQLQNLLNHLPADIAVMIEVAYITGWRVKSELQPMEWRQIDFEDNWMYLYQSKNNEGRRFPLTGRLLDLLNEQRRHTDEVERKTHRIIPNVFHRNGEPIRWFIKAWRTACKATGLAGRIPHDLRRSAVRNMVRSGVSEAVAMKLTGHKTRMIFSRYNITDQNDLREAGKKLLGTAQSLHNQDRKAAGESSTKLQFKQKGLAISHNRDGSS